MYFIYKKIPYIIMDLLYVGGSVVVSYILKGPSHMHTSLF